LDPSCNVTQGALRERKNEVAMSSCRENTMRTPPRAAVLLLALTSAVGATLLVSLAGCGESTAEFGVVTGQVTIRPLSPVEEGEAIPTPPPELYEDRVILIYGPGGEEVVRRAEINGKGVYREELVPGTYVVDIRGVGPVSAAGLPKTIEVSSGETVRVNVVIDTGIR
jgi:hypothetical protein